MTLKNAALLALIGTILMTALLVWTFVFNFLNLMRGLVPAVTLFSSFIYAFGCFSVAVFFFVFHNAKKALFKGTELYLLRNQSRGKGIGFFEAGNFYPDFILWLLVPDRQYVTFVDPKGSCERSAAAGW